jgi:carbon monoxide dehydrogenase subunit G
MALDVTATIDISRPPDAVAAYVFEPSHDPTWIGGVRAVEMVSPPPMQVGSRVRRTGAFMGRRIEWLMEVVDLVPGRRLAMHAIQSPFPMDVAYELEPAPSGTRASIRVQGEPGGSYRLAGPLLGPMVRRSISSDARRLKQAIEAR